MLDSTSILLMVRTPGNKPEQWIRNSQPSAHANGQLPARIKTVLCVPRGVYNSLIHCLRLRQVRSA